MSGLPTGRVLGVRHCPHCDFPTDTPANICPECGEPLQIQPKLIRCRQCGDRSLSSLALCPHCGRELRAAPPRLLTWGAPLVIVVLFLGLFVARWDGGNPVDQAAASLQRMLALFDGLGEQVEPNVVIVMTPVTADGESDASAVAEVNAAIDAAPAAEAQAAPAAGEQEQPPTQEEQPALPPPTDTAVPPTATETAVPETPTPAPTATALLPALAGSTPTPEEVAENSPVTNTAVSAAALLPTATPIVTSTETVSSPPVPPLTSRGALVVSIVGTSQPPTATPAPTATSTTMPTAMPTATATATASQVTYKIRPGDTLVVIASRFDVSVNELMAANDLAANDVFTIQPGQILVIPSSGGTAPATPTSSPTVAATATAAATQAPPTPEPTPTVGWRLDAPSLRSPENGTPVGCSTTDSLVWLPVPYMSANDVYVMHLGYVNGYAADGTEQIMWVLEQPRPANVTSWDMDGDVLCALAPQEFGRQWRWYVQVAEEVDGKLTPVSPPSAIWGFAWN